MDCSKFKAGQISCTKFKRLRVKSIVLTELDKRIKERETNLEEQDDL
jgi:hypothetical protein